MKKLMLWLLLVLNTAIVLNEQPTETHYIELKIKEVQSIVKIDNDRRLNKDKIISVIETYNQQMSEELKDVIVNEIQQMTVKYPNLSVDLICALITHESARTWNPKVVSHAGAIGLMQVMPHTGKRLARTDNSVSYTSKRTLEDPVSNIRLGSRYLSYLLEHNDLEGSLIGYNAGEYRLQQWINSGKDYSVLPIETQNYGNFVMKTYDRIVNEL